MSAVTEPLGGIHNAFDAWYTGAEEGRDAAWKAFVAGVAWAQTTMTAPAGTALTFPVEGVGGTESPEAVTAIVGNRRLLIGEGDTFNEDVEPLDAVTAATVLAALAFYRDNQLVYGVVPSQLTAEQVTDLILSLTPSEEVPA